MASVIWCRDVWTGSLKTWVLSPGSASNLGVLWKISYFPSIHNGRGGLNYLQEIPQLWYSTAVRPRAKARSQIEVWASQTKTVDIR